MSWKGKDGKTFELECNLPVPNIRRGPLSSFDPAYHPAMAQGMYRMGATNFEVAAEFEVSHWTLFKWKMRFPEFAKACQLGKDAADDRVKDSLYHRAIGYTYPATKFFAHEGEVIAEPYVEHVPPDVTAAKFWLTNRKPEEWKEKVEHGHSGSGKGGAIPIVVTSDDKALL
jgi:hypothetical protein